MGKEAESTIAEIKKSLGLLAKRMDWETAKFRLEELNAMSESSDLWSDSLKARKLMRERQFLSENIDSYEKLTKEFDELKELLSLAVSENDAELINETETLLSNLKVEVSLRETEALLSGEADVNDSYLEINAGAGGTESCDWATMLYRMYCRWAEKQSYLVEIISENPGEEVGLKSITLRIKGPNAYGWLKSESGVHRLVRISPFDSNAKRHTSFCSVWVYPVIDENISIEILPSDIRVDTYRSSGAGGQHVNTTDSAVRITHIETGIVVTSSEKSQHQNRANCMNALKSRLFEIELRKKTQSTQEAHDKKGDAGWGNQIRSYVLQPYQMVKDLRTNHETSNSQRVLDGDLSDFMSSALALKVSGKSRFESTE